jgi:hypothetical protein
MQHRILLAAALALAVAAPAAAQGTIARGMSPAQVRGVFGNPARERSEGTWTYWFYSNGCPRRCGSDDVVFFQDERVVAAVLRTHTRRIQAPAAADALGEAGGGVANADAIRAQAGEGESAPAPARIRVRGRSRDAQDAMGSTDAPARVGRIHVESGGRVIDRQTSGAVRDNAADDGQSTIIRTGEGAAVVRGDSSAVAASDSIHFSTAVTSDDKRTERESEVRRNTVQNQPDTTQARQHNRERSVLPRVVPRP